MDDGFCLRYESSVTMEYGAKIGHSLFTIEHRDELECVPNHDRQPPIGACCLFALFVQLCTVFRLDRA